MASMGNRLYPQVPLGGADDDTDEGESMNLHDMGDDRGFGGVAGANRHIPPHDHSKVETCPEAEPANYGPEPGREADYGSKGLGEKPADMVSGSRVKASGFRR